jgi:hypothetical protein
MTLSISRSSSSPARRWWPSRVSLSRLFQSIGNLPTEDEVTTTGDRQRCAPPEGTVPNSHSAFVAAAYRVSIQLRGARSQRNLNMQIRGVSRMRAPSGRNRRADR